MSLKQSPYPFIFIISLVSLPKLAWAQQTNEQLWFEYMLNSPFSNSYNLENAVVYSTLLNPSSKWRAFDYTPTLEFSIDQHIDLITAVTLSYTDQTESYSVTVDLWAPTSLGNMAPDHTCKTVLHTNGIATIQVPAKR